jgi:acetylornithine deacetylase/succinyl-diaminopimelate desuccinylase-like protein
VDYFLEDFPAGGPDEMASPGEEGKVVAILQKELAARSIKATTHAKVPGRENLLARVGKARPGYRKLMVLLHTDVVPSGDPSVWKFAPFEPFEKEGKLYGRGVLDDKGPLASAFATLLILNKYEQFIDGEFIFGAVGDEEVGIGVGIEYLLEQKLIMSLSIGTKLGSVEVLGIIGRGGMGEVYRARDTKLACNFLETELGSNGDQYERRRDCSRGRLGGVNE